MKDLVLFGMPGVGKGTQADLIAQDQDQYVHLSTWDIFRAITSRPNAIGDYVNSRINAWFLIDDQVTISIFNAYFFAVKDKKKYMLLDGYPRTMIQLDALLSLSHQQGRELIGINFELIEQVAITRMLGRWREGENKEVIKKRFDEYYSKTNPLLKAFKKHADIITIDSSPDIQTIHQQVMRYVTNTP